MTSSTWTIDRPRLSEFFVYVPSLCQVEGEEHKKILYYFPSSTPLNDQLNSVGLCEAVNTFTEFFESTCLSLQTLYTKRFFRRLSHEVWVAMVVALPRSDGVEESAQCSVNNSVMDSLLATACQTFQLFNGTVQAIIDSGGFDSLKSRLQHFFPRYLRTMLFEHCDIIDCFNGIHFVSVDPSDHAKVQGFLNRIRYAFSCIEHLAFFCDGLLLHSTLDLESARNIYHYLNSFLFTEQPDLCHSGVNTTAKHLGRFLIGPHDLSDTTQRVQCPVLCSPGSTLPDCQLICYQALRAVICLLVRGIDPIPMTFFAQFDMMVGPRMTILGERLAANPSSYSMNTLNNFPVHPAEATLSPTQPTVVTLSAVGYSTGVIETLAGDHITSAVEHITDDDDNGVLRLLANSPERQTFIIYWNPLTMAVMTTLHVFTGSGRRPILGAKRILATMVSLREELQLRSDAFHDEITVQLDDNIWVMVRRTNGREIYMLFIRKHDCFGRVDRYAEQLYNTVFKGLLLLE